jgi:hypothetical protein
MNCRKCRIEIEEKDLRRESLSGAAEAHAGSCAECRAFGEERLALRRLVGGLERVSAPADFDFRVRARLAAERGAAAPRTAAAGAWFKFSPAALSWPLAGCLALIVSASLYFQPRQPDAAGATPAAEQARSAPAATDALPQTPVAASIAASAAEVKPSGERAAGDETRPRVELAASSIPTAPERRRVSPSRLTAGRAGVERAAAAEVVESTSTGLLGATPRFAASGAARSEGALIPVQLDAPEGQLKVLLRDTTGGARTISVDSVSFGSRDVMKRPGATYTKASLSTNQGVW